MQERFDFTAALVAGLVAGTAFVLLEMLLVAGIGGESPWGPPRMMAAIAMGREALPPPATFDAPIAAVGMAVHFALSVAYAVALGWAIARWRLGLAAAILGGTVFGLALYVVNFYLFTSLFPWFAMARNWMTILAHGVFGAVLGWVYRAMAGGTSEPVAR